MSFIRIVVFCRLVFNIFDLFESSYFDYRILIIRFFVKVFLVVMVMKLGVVCLGVDGYLEDYEFFNCSIGVYFNTFFFCLRVRFK